MSNGYPCEFTEEVEITFYDSPELVNVSTVCDNTGSSYVLTVELTGGDQDSYETYGLIAGTWDGPVFTSSDIPSGDDYSIVFQDVNACNEVEVSGTLNCDCQTNAGTLDAAPQTLCEAQSFGATVIVDGTLDGDDNAIYYLHDGSDLLSSNIIDQNDNGNFDFTSNGLSYETSYYITYVVGNADGADIDFTDDCTSFSQTQEFVFNETPVIDAGDEQTVCSLNTILDGSLSTGLGSWSASGPGTVVFNDNNNPQTLLEVSQGGQYTLTWTVENGECQAADTVLINFQEGFSASLDESICNADNSFYFVSIVIIGVDDADLVNTGTTMGTVSNGIFTTDPIPTGDPYNVELSSALADCDPLLFEGQFSCDCETQVGDMSDIALHLCNGENAVVQFTADQTADADDLAFYVLHDGGPFFIGNILDQNQTGEFEFDSAYTEDESYFIAYVLGNPSNGFVDLDDDCTAISSGQPVIWHSVPEVSVAADGLINCEQEIVELAASTNSHFGKFYWEGPGINPANANDQNPNVDIPGDYYVSVVDTLTYCISEEAHLSIDLVVDDELTATVDVNEPLCPGDNTGSIALLEVMDNAQYSITLNGVPVSEENDWSNLAADEYLLSIVDIQGCDWDTLIVIPDPAPINIDLGPDITIEPGESVQLEIDADFVIESATWDNAPFISCLDCEMPVVNPDQTTTYTVNALNDFGCHDDDSITIFVEHPNQTIQVPTAFSPNGDGLNDVVTVLAVDGGDHTVLNFRIFNRWGEKVFENYDFPPNDHAEGWDGMIKGEEAELSVYAYFTEVLLENGRTKTVKGNITLIR